MEPGRRRMAGWAVSMLLAAAATALAAEVAWARAGGGGGFGGGGGGGGFGGGGGGGFGGGHGGGGDDFLWLWLIVEHPYIGVPVALACLAAVVWLNAYGMRVRGRSVVRRGARAHDKVRAAAAVETLRQRDPAFDAEAFCRRVEAAFVKIQQAWCAQDLAAVEHFISDSVAERFALQIDEQKDLGYRDHMEKIRIADLRVEEARTYAWFDQVTVRVKAWAVDYRQSLATGKRLSGATQPEPFVEFWSFLRRGKVRTRPGEPGLMEGHCPNCGAAIRMNQFGRCAYCEAELRSGAHDWVLAEITQGGEWKPTPDRALPGVPALRRRDKGFSIQHVEDRASVIFWRRYAAGRTGNIDPLAPVASPEYRLRYGEEVAKGVRPNAGRRCWYGEGAVGAVECLGVMAGEKLDQAFVSIRWSGALFTSARGGKARQTGEQAVFHSLYVLGRRADARSNIDASITSAHCSSCGAALSSEADRCEHCGAALNDGSRDWFLLDVLVFCAEAAQGQLRAMREASQIAKRRPEPTEPIPLADAPPTSAGIIAWMVKSMVADGRIDERERAMLNAAAVRCSMPPAALDRVIEAAKAGCCETVEPTDAKEGRQWLTSMATVALADGRIAPAEKKLLTTVGERLGLSRHDVATMVKREHARMVRESRQYIRRAKGLD